MNTYRRKLKSCFDLPIAYKMYGRMYGGSKFHEPSHSTKMCCPFCGDQLVQGESHRLESLEEHVSDPNGTPSYKPTGYCKNPDCKFGRFYMWSLIDGGSYGYGYIDYFYNRNADGSLGELKEGLKEEYDEMKSYNTSATNSFEMKCDIEIYKKGLLSEIRLSPLFALGIAQPVIEVVYTANEAGKILSRRFKLKWIGYDERSNSWCIGGPSWVHMFFYMLKEYKKDLRKLNDPKHQCYELFSEVFIWDPQNNRHEWVGQSYKRVAKWLFRVMHLNSYYKYKKLLTK